jgi:hypothetical protein
MTLLGAPPSSTVLYSTERQGGGKFLFRHWRICLRMFWRCLGFACQRFILFLDTAVAVADV